MVTLDFDEVAHRQQHGPGAEVQLAALLLRVEWMESIKVDTVAHHMQLVVRNAQLAQRLGQRNANADGRIGPARGPADHAAGQPVLRNQIEIGSPGRDDHRLAQPLAQQRCGNAIGVEIVRIDDVEVEACTQQPPNGAERRRGQQHGRRCHAQLGDQRIAWVMHDDAIAHFMQRGARHARVVTKPRVGRRKPGHRCHHLRIDPARLQQLAQTGFNEDAMTGPHTAGKQCGEGQQPDR